MDFSGFWIATENFGVFFVAIKQFSCSVYCTLSCSVYHFLYRYILYIDHVFYIILYTTIFCIPSYFYIILFTIYALFCISSRASLYIFRVTDIILYIDIFTSFCAFCTLSMCTLLYLIHHLCTLLYFVHHLVYGHFPYTILCILYIILCILYTMLVYTTIHILSCIPIYFIHRLVNGWIEIW